jgi:hypothetical protein
VPRVLAVGRTRIEATTTVSAALRGTIEGVGKTERAGGRRCGSIGTKTAI